MPKLRAATRRMLIALAGLAAIYVAVCVALFLLQRSMIYFPQPRHAPPGTPLLSFTIEGRQVLATTREKEGERALIYFGGNSEDVSSSLPGLSSLFPEHALYLLHYPGYGGAPGHPTEAALIADAFALFDRVVARHPRVTVLGRSLGSGVAVQVASARPVEQLVLVAPYDSIQGVAEERFPMLPVSWILKDKFDSASHVSGIKAPTLIIKVENDKVIPGASTDRLVARFPKGQATLGVVAGSYHNFPDTHPDYVRLLRGLDAASPRVAAPASAASR
jgi:pimeloyl-ACP methyl ester carboxylesterase